MNRQDLVEAVVRAGGVPLDRLNKDELLRLARLLGIRLLTLEARVVVHGDDRGDAGSSPLLLAPVPAGRVPPVPARPARPELAGPGAGQLALAVRLVEQGADTLERTRRSQYRG